MRVLLHGNRPRSVNGAERSLRILVEELRRSPRVDAAEIVFAGDAAPPGRWDLVHGFDVRPHRTAFAHRLGLPAVLTSHVAGWQNVRQGWRTGRRNPVLRMGQVLHHARMLLLEDLAIRDCAAVIPISRNTLDELVVQAPWARRKLHLVENGVDPQAFPVGEDDGGYGLFVGRMEWVKRPDVAVKAFRRLGLPLKMVGGGTLLQALRAAAPSNVSFERPDDEGLARLYRGASVVVVPSQSEGYPLVVLEALSSGAPVVSTRSFVADPPARDLIHWLDHGVFASRRPSEQGDALLVEDLVAAVRSLWGSKDAAGARRRHEVVAASNSWRGHARAVVDVYERVLAGR